MGYPQKKSNDMYIYIIIGVICILAYLGYRYIKSTQDNISKVNNELQQCKQNINDLSDFILQNNYNDIEEINNTPTNDTQPHIQNNIKPELQIEPQINLNQRNEHFQEIKQQPIQQELSNIPSTIGNTTSVKDSDLQSIFSDTYSRKDDINNLDDFIVSMNKKTSKKSKAVRKRKPRQKKKQETTKKNITNTDSPKIEEIKQETTNTIITSTNHPKIQEIKSEEKNEL